MAEPVLSIEDLTVGIRGKGDRHLAVEGVSLRVMPNEILCLVGESGSGKSVTAHAAMGLLPESLPVFAGNIRLAGRNLLDLGEADWRTIRGVEIGMVFQEPAVALNPLMRIGDQVSEVLWAHGHRDRSENIRRVAKLLTAVGLPDPERVRKAFPFQLSGGQRQRAMIAIALSLQPRLLIADEPTTALDVTTQARVLRLIKEMQQERQMGVLFITHDFGVVAEIADRVAVMQSGRIVESGPVHHVLKGPEHPYTQQLLAAIPRPGKARAGLIPGAPVLEVKGLSKSYFIPAGMFSRGRKFPAVRDVSLSVSRGEILGLVGESGSGKSTVGRMILRLVGSDAGSIRIGGTNIASFSGRQLRPFRPRTQLIFQDPYGSLNPRTRVGEIIAAGPIAQGVDPAIARQKASDLLKLVDLDPRSANRYPHEFSGGQRQRIAIARALALQPEILVADEPVSALDVTVQDQVLKLLLDLRESLGLAMLFITHDLRVAARICDRIAVMRAGEVVETGDAERVLANPQHAYTRELLTAIPGESLLHTLSSHPVGISAKPPLIEQAGGRT